MAIQKDASVLEIFADDFIPMFWMASPCYALRTGPRHDDDPLIVPMSHPSPVHGWLVVDKPLGLTSNALNGRVRKLLRCRKTGFAGTLDPLATGVLPIAVGEATKTIPYLMHRLKTYRFTLQWGEDRDTGDAEGAVIATSAVVPSEDQIQEVLPLFQGDILQTPPAHSALKIAGVRACDRVRRGEEVKLNPRPIFIQALTLEGSDPGQHTSTFEVLCGSGTYVRSLAVDLAHALGTCGYVQALRRTSVGPFRVEDAFPLASLEKIGHSEGRHVIRPVDVVLDDIPDIALTDAQAQMLRQGQPCCLDPHAVAEGAMVWTHGVYTRQIVAIAKVQHRKIYPVRVFNWT